MARIRARFMKRLAVISVVVAIVSIFGLAAGWLARKNLHMSIGNNKTRLIVMWTRNFGKDYFGGKPAAVECEVGSGRRSCILTSKRSLVTAASAVVFHARDVNWTDVPPSRHAHQRYVFFAMESPFYTYIDLTNSSGFFNWTMTHRRDSDIYSPYGGAAFVANATKLPNSTTVLSTKNHSRLIVWVASNCHTSSKRERIVENLSQWVPVDIFGSCGQSAPFRSGHSNAEIRQFIAGYKFHLAFENSICKDYITEKFWDRLWLDTVTVVMQRSIYENVVPVGSFIAVDDFESLKQLADHLTYLNSHDEAYLSHFAWRANYVKAGITGNEICTLCNTLHTAPLAHASYKDLSNWWVNESHCDHGEFSTRFA